MHVDLDPDSPQDEVFEDETPLEQALPQPDHQVFAPSDDVPTSWNVDAVRPRPGIIQLPTGTQTAGLRVAELTGIQGMENPVQLQPDLPALAMWQTAIEHMFQGPYKALAQAQIQETEDKSTRNRRTHPHIAIGYPDMFTLLSEIQ